MRYLPLGLGILFAACVLVRLLAWLVEPLTVPLGVLAVATTAPYALWRWRL